MGAVESESNRRRFEPASSTSSGFQCFNWWLSRHVTKPRRKLNDDWQFLSSRVDDWSVSVPFVCRAAGSESEWLGEWGVPLEHYARIDFCFVESRYFDCSFVHSVFIVTETEMYTHFEVINKDLPSTFTSISKCVMTFYLNLKPEPEK